MKKIDITIPVNVDEFAPVANSAVLNVTWKCGDCQSTKEYVDKDYLLKLMKDISNMYTTAASTALDAVINVVEKI